MDTVIEIEICLQYLNNLLAKSTAFTDKESVQKLNSVKRLIYYGDFVYSEVMQKLSDINKNISDSHVRI